MNSHKAEFTVSLDAPVVDAILSALHHHAGEMAAREARRTGGRGFASGGVAHGVEQAHRAQALLRWARVRTYEWRRDPEGRAWKIVGADDLNYTLSDVLSNEQRTVGKTVLPHAQRVGTPWDDGRPYPWHGWPVVPEEEKPVEPPEGWTR